MMASDVRQSGYLPPIRPLNLDLYKSNSPQHISRSLSITDQEISPKTRYRPSPTFPPSNTLADPPGFYAVSNAAHALTTLGKRSSSGERIETPPKQSQATRYSLPSLSEALRMEDSNSKPKTLDRVPSLPHFSSQPSEYARSPPTSHPTQQKTESTSTRADSNPTWTTTRTQYAGHVRPASPSGKLDNLKRESTSSSHYSNYPAEDGHRTYSRSSPNRQTNHRSSRDEFDPPRRDFTSEPRQNSTSTSGVYEKPSSTWQAFNQPQAMDNDKVKALNRHLGEFDLEQSLTSISEASKRLFDFSEYYRNRAYQTSRSGPLPGSTPLIQEIEDMLSQGHAIQTSLEYLQRVVNTQQAALAERSREQATKPTAIVLSEDNSAYQEESRDGGYGGSDPKKRRGRVAPPGRCHSCNRAETPEWRRGPDGARTLCNACGLHYAKLTRKMGGNKSNLGNIQPKTMGTTSAAKLA